LPAPHDRVEFRIQHGGIVQYSGRIEDLISADVITAEMIGGRRIPPYAVWTRRDKSGARIFLRFGKVGLKDRLIVEFREGLKLALPGITGEIVAAATARLEAEEQRFEREYERRVANRDEAPADEEEDLDPHSISIDRQVGREIGMLMAIADDDATTEDLIALIPEFKAKLLARKAKRGTERKRPDFLRLVIDNEART
jgi:hypothetical protein